MNGLDASPEHDLSNSIAPHLPQLRRFARALTGSQSRGDAFVVATLEAILADRGSFDSTMRPRVALFQAFYRIWASADGDANMEAAPEATDEARAQKRLAQLTPRSRQALLLTAMEEFAPSDAALVMGVDAQEFDMLRSDAVKAIEDQIRARTLIIEDEPIIAMDIRAIVEGLGHSVIDIADTRQSAVEIALESRPDLVLADIQLADGSSGIDAVKDILGAFDVPVIFITAYPDRLLTGERPEPTFLISKPFRAEAVQAAIGQALFFERTVAA